MRHWELAKPVPGEPPTEAKGMRAAGGGDSAARRAPPLDNNKEGKQPTGAGTSVPGEPAIDAKGAEAAGGGDSAPRRRRRTTTRRVNSPPARGRLCLASRR